MEKRDAFALYGRSALEYWRLAAGASPALGEPPREATRILEGGSERGTFARRVAETAHELGLSYPVELAVSDAEQRRCGSLAHCHVWRLPPKMPAAVRVDPGILVCTPEVALLQAARDCDYVDLLQLVLEFTGCYVLSPADELSMVVLEAPLVSLRGLRSVSQAAAAAHAAGSKRLADVLRIAADGSKSPAESKLFTLLSVERRRGGFGIPSIQLNLRVNLEGVARMNLDLQGIRPDLFEPKGRSAIEYQSGLHPVLARANDDRRSDALEAMGVRTFQIDRVRARDLRDLSGVASVIAERAHIRRRPPTRDLLLRRAKLHGRLFLSNGTHVNCDPSFLSTLTEAADTSFYPI